MYCFIKRRTPTITKWNIFDPLFARIFHRLLFKFPPISWKPLLYNVSFIVMNDGSHLQAFSFYNVPLFKPLIYKFPINICITPWPIHVIQIKGVSYFKRFHNIHYFNFIFWCHRLYKFRHGVNTNIPNAEKTRWVMNIWNNELDSNWCIFIYLQISFVQTTNWKKRAH